MDLPHFASLAGSHPLFFVVLYLGACLGHGALLIFLHNRLLGFPYPLPRPLVRTGHKILMGLIVTAPAWMGFLLAWDLAALAVPEGTAFPGWDLASIVAIYLLLCWAVGFGIAPAAEIRYWLRRRPALPPAPPAQTLDVAGVLGYPPVGRGKHRRLARLPGNQVFRVEFTERVLELPRLPAAWDGLTILHLTDLHLCGTPDRAFYQVVMERCREWEPDLLALTGDIVDSKRHHRWVVPVLGRLRWRVAAFAILGNHDKEYEAALTRRRLQRIGMKVLGNRWVRMEVRGTPLTVIGHEGPWFRPAPDLSGCPADGFRLCLSHTPDNLPWACRHGIDFVLAGHNHGGQIRLPLIGSVFVPSRYGRRFDGGAFSRGRTLMYVSRGLAGMHPLRYNCLPEVTRIVLRQVPRVRSQESEVQGQASGVRDESARALP